MPTLYIHENYNVRTYPNDIQETNFLKEIRNQIATTVMRKINLPSAMLIMISNDLLDDAVFTIECMEGALCWLFDEILEIIKFQWKCLPQKSKKRDEPRIYMLKALPKPQKIPKSNLYKGVRRKFNAMLQTILEDYHGFGFINAHEITTREKDEKFFISNYDGALSDEGIIQLWMSISQTFKAMDDGLKAKALVSDKNVQTDPRIGQHHNNYQSPMTNRTQENSSATPRRFNRGQNYNNNYYNHHDKWRRH